MIKFSKKKLKNGLTVIVHSDAATPMAAVNLLYKVGSKNENPDRTGFAHLFEHLMFGGSQNLPEFDTPIQLAAGENNAFTNNDFTNYYIALPKENIETALWAESDRMRNLTLNQKSLDVQKKVVIEEFSQRYLNQPYGDMWMLLRSLCYKTHPYQWATIGKEISHIEKATLGDVKAFYDRYYTPSNAILSIGANMTEETMFELAEKWFDDIEALPTHDDNIPQECEQTEARLLEVERDVPVTVVYMAFPMQGRDSLEFSICDVMTDVLSNGTSSRLYQRLVKESTMLTSVNAYVSGDFDSGLLILSAKLLDETTPQMAIDALWKEIDELKTEMVSDYELQKVKNKFEATTLFSQINVLDKAMNLGFYEFLSDADMYNNEKSVHSSITADQIMETAKKLMRPERSNTLIYKARKNQNDSNDETR